MNVEQQHQVQSQYLSYQPEWLVDDPPEMVLGDPSTSSSPSAKSKKKGGASGGGGGGKGKEPSKISLADLKDCPPGVKPYHAYSTLIRYAIKGSPQGKLLLEDIYEALMLRFEYFRNAPPGWKNSVRHNLSLNPMFVKVERPLTDRGKGYYWTVRDEEGLDARTGVHRNRKKKSDSVGGGGGSKKPVSAGGVAGPGVPGFPHPAYMIPDEASMAALQNQLSPYPRDQLVPEVSPTGEVDWRASWWNEITKLQQFTNDQEKQNVGPEWYRWMFEHMRATFGHPAVIGTGTTAINVGSLPPGHGADTGGDMAVPQDDMDDKE